MGDKPIYEYPPRLGKAQRQAKAFNDINEHKKMRRQMYKNLILGGVIFVIALMVPVALVKILLILVAVGNAAVGLLLYRFYALSRDTALYTRIYEDRLEHCQSMGLMGDMLRATLYYEDVKSCEQNTRGRLVVKLKEGYNSRFEYVKKNGSGASCFPKENVLTLSFVDTAAKLTLIKDFGDRINYPKKNYNEITDDDDWYSEEDLKWDKLHKHGL